MVPLPFRKHEASCSNCSQLRQPRPFGGRGCGSRVSVCLFFLGALLETKCDCVLAAEGKLVRTHSFLFGLSEAADLLEGNRCSLLLPVRSQPVNGERRG